MPPGRRRTNRPALIFFLILGIGALIWIVYFVGSNVSHLHDMKVEKSEGRPSVTPTHGAP